MSAAPPNGKASSPGAGWRLQRLLARAGCGSRRACESLILAGRVRVNDLPVAKLGTRVIPGRDSVTVDGRPVEVSPARHYILNKPARCLCTRRDPQGRPTVYDCVERMGVDPGALAYVGRLDWASEGLLFLTTDGWLADRMAHPRHHLLRTYRVRIAGPWAPHLSDRLLAGIADPLLGLTLRARRVRVVGTSPDGSATELEIDLDEGRNRQIRRMMSGVQRRVIRLVRTHMGPLALGSLAPGRLRPASRAEIEALRRHLGGDRAASQ